MLNASPARTPQDTKSQGTRPESNKGQNKKLFSDIAMGALCCDRRSTPPLPLSFPTPGKTAPPPPWERTRGGEGQGGGVTVETAVAETVVAETVVAGSFTQHQHSDPGSLSPTKPMPTHLPTSHRTTQSSTTTYRYRAPT